MTNSNHSSQKRGVFPVSGGYVAMTYAESKHFKTWAGASKWLGRRGFNHDGTRKVQP